MKEKVMAKNIFDNIKNEDLFLDSNIRDFERTAIMRSEYWPSFVNVYNNTGGEVRCVQTDPNYPSDGLTITNKIGVPCMTINRSGNGKYRLFSVNNSYNIEGSSITTEAESAKISYIQSLLRKSSGRGYDIIGRTTHNANQFPAVCVRHALTQVVYSGELSPIRKTLEVSVPNNLITQLLMYYAGRQDKYATDTTAIDKIIKDYDDRSSSRTVALNKLKEFFANDKFFLVPSVMGGVILGVLSKEPFLALANRLNSESSLPYENAFSYVNPVVPLKWYRKYDHIPQDLLESLRFSSMILKTHTGSDANLPPQCGVWVDVGAVMSTRFLDCDRVLLMDKMG
jgi:hypothetical protein